MGRVVVVTTAALAVAVAVWTTTRSWMPARWAEYVTLVAIGATLSLAGAWTSSRSKMLHRTATASPSPARRPERATA